MSGSTSTPRATIPESKLKLDALADYSEQSDSSDTELNRTVSNISISPKPKPATSNKRPRNSSNDSASSFDIPPKRSRPIINMLPCFAAVVAMESFVVDIMLADENQALTEAQGKTIGNSITRALFASDNFADLKFESSGFERGRYRTVCSDATTRDWVIAIVPQLDGLWQGAELRAVRSGAPARLVRSSINVTLPTIDPNDMFTIIGTQNPTINTENWKLYSRSKAQAGRQQWIIGVDEASIPALREIGCRPYCGMSRIRIFLPNNAV